MLDETQSRPLPQSLVQSPRSLLRRVCRLARAHRLALQRNVRRRRTAHHAFQQLRGDGTCPKADSQEHCVSQDDPRRIASGDAPLPHLDPRRACGLFVPSNDGQQSERPVHARPDARAVIARRTHGVVARRALWHVRALGPLRDSSRLVERQERLRRMDPRQRAHPDRPVRDVPRTVEPGRVRRRRMGSHGKGRGHALPRADEQTPRRLLPVRQQGDGLGRHEHAARPRHLQGARGRMRAPRRRVLPLPLDHGLASPGLPAAASVGGTDAQRRRRGLRALRTLPARASHRGRDELPSGSAVVRRRMGVDVEPRTRHEAVRSVPFARASDARQQPRRRASRRHGGLLAEQ